MGGPGVGHKSWRAREARLANIKKARAARKRAPLPWRSSIESRVIEQLVWQWWLSRTPNPVPVNAKARPWAKYRVARFLGVSHTWVNKLVKRFEADPDRTRRRMAAFAPATFEKLEQARAETLRQLEQNLLRGPIRHRRVSVTLEGKKRKVIVTTNSEARRRQAPQQAPSISAPNQPRGSPGQLAATAPPRYQEIPAWAKGFLPPAAAPPPRHAPRPVPFAFRRRR